MIGKRLVLSVSACVVVLITLAWNTNPVYALTITVTTDADENTDNSVCSLREAIIAANTNNPYNGCTTGVSGSDTIDLSGFTTYSLSSVLPTVTSAIVIDGGGATIQPAVSSPVYRALSVTGNTLTLQNVTISGFAGAISIAFSSSVVLNSGAVLSGNSGLGVQGGGIFASSGSATNATITVNAGASITGNTAMAISSGAGGGIYCAPTGSGTCVIDINGGSITNNHATNEHGGGIYGANNTLIRVRNGARIAENTTPNIGGGIFTVNAEAQIEVNNATIEGNQARFGGGIGQTFSGTLTVENGAIIQNNIATERGGGISNGGGTLTIDASTVQNNEALGGAGIHNNSGTVTIENGSRITGNNNSAPSGGGGGILNAGAAALLTIDDSIISLNTDPAAGGGIYNAGGDVIIRNGSSIIDNSTSGDGGGIYSGSATASVDISGSFINDNDANRGGGVFNTSGSSVTIHTLSQLQLNSASSQGSAYYANHLTSGSSDSITNSCIVANPDSILSLRYAVYDTGGAVTTATDNWWGTAWGPLILDLNAAQNNPAIGSAVSNGDSINGNGTNRVNVGLINDGTWSQQPTGNWKPTAPTGCMSCSAVSSVGHSRTCS